MGRTTQKKLKELGAKDQDIPDLIEIFANSSDIDTFREEIGKKHWGAGYLQVLDPLFKEIYLKDKHVQEEMHEALQKFGISKKGLDEYFTSHIKHGDLFIHTTHEEIPLKERLQFLEESNGLMYKILKKYLEI